MTPARATVLRSVFKYGPSRVSSGLAKQIVEFGEGTVWRLRPPPSPEWPEGHWAYAAAPEDATADEVLEVVGERYVGDWSPENVKWTVQRVRSLRDFE